MRSLRPRRLLERALTSSLELLGQAERRVLRREYSGLGEDQGVSFSSLEQVVRVLLTQDALARQFSARRGRFAAPHSRDEPRDLQCLHVCPVSRRFLPKRL